MTFSDGRRGSYRNNLYYMAYEAARFYKANGAGDRHRPRRPAFPAQSLDLVQRLSAKKGQPWPMDIAFDPDGVPAIVYSSRVGSDDDFRYARWNGERWVTRLISVARRRPVRLSQRRASRSTTPTRTGSC